MAVVLLSATVCALAQPSILVTDGLAPSAMTLLAASGAAVVQQHYTAQELDDGSLAEHDAVIIRSATSLSAAAISATFSFTE